MSAHTPGPWFDDGYRIYAPTTDADKCNGRVIVEYKHVDDFNAADAPLIAAAPDLLYTLKALVSLDADPMPYDSATTLAAARAAIAKAEGR